LGPRHSFWSVLGPAEAPSFGPGSRASRGGINPARSDVAENTAQAKVQELVLILGEANRVAGRCLQIFSRIRQDCDLTGIEVLTLIAIAQATTSPTVPQIGRSLSHPRQVIQRAVRVLEERGLVRPLPNPGHKRAALLEATEAGRALGLALDAQAAKIVSDLADSLELDMGVLGAMSDGLLALRDRIDERISLTTG
jgi:DNA-binding MarR family transcriptional regulator